MCPLSKETWYWDASNVTEMVLSGVKCSGHEMALSHCQQDSSATCRKTGPRFAAGVICSESEWAGQKLGTDCQWGGGGYGAIQWPALVARLYHGLATGSGQKAPGEHGCGSRWKWGHIWGIK